jgi:hypothetical protein
MTAPGAQDVLDVLEVGGRDVGRSIAERGAIPGAAVVHLSGCRTTTCPGIEDRVAPRSSKLCTPPSAMPIAYRS